MIYYSLQRKLDFLTRHVLPSQLDLEPAARPASMRPSWRRWRRWATRAWRLVSCVVESATIVAESATLLRVPFGGCSGRLNGPGRRVPRLPRSLPDPADVPQPPGHPPFRSSNTRPLGVFGHQPMTHHHPTNCEVDGRRAPGRARAASAGIGASRRRRRDARAWRRPRSGAPRHRRHGAAASRTSATRALGGRRRGMPRPCGMLPNLAACSRGRARPLPAPCRSPRVPSRAAAASRSTTSTTACSSPPRARLRQRESLLQQRAQPGRGGERAERVRAIAGGRAECPQARERARGDVRGSAVAATRLLHVCCTLRAGPGGVCLRRQEDVRSGSHASAGRARSGSGPGEPNSASV